MKRKISILLSLMLVLSFAFQAMGFLLIPVKSIKLNVSSIVLDAGKTYNLKVSYTPENTTQRTVKYSSSDSNISTIDAKGKITAKKAGKATITVTSLSNKNVVSKCIVTVKASQTVPSYINEAGLPIAKKLIKMTMVTVRQPNGGMADDLWYFKWTRERANIDFRVKQIELAAWGQTKNILFASGDLPNVFLHCGFTPDDLVRFGVVEGQLLDLTQYVGKYASNIKKLYDSNKEMKSIVTTPDGKMYTFPTIVDESFAVRLSNRSWINQTWLNKVGMKEPNTVDELYKVLKAFKEKDPNGNGKADEIPFGGSWNEGYAENDMILAAFGLPVRQNDNKYPVSIGLFPAVNDKLKLHVLQPEYKDYLIYMNKLWTEGLIDKDIFTQTQVQARAKSSQNLMGLTSDGAPHVIDDARYTDWVAITPMTSNVNSKKVWASTSQASIGQFIVTKKVKYPEALVRLADMYFTDKGAVDFWHGPMQGSPDLLGYDGWFIKDGVMYYKYTEKGNNGWNYTNAYMNPINGYKLGFVPVSKHIERAYNTEPLQDDSKQKWWVESMEKKVKPYLVKSLPSVLYYDSKSLQRKNELTTALDEYVAQMTAKFIVGDESFSNYDKFITQVKKLGAEEYVSIVQKTYDNYLNNLK